MTISSGYLTFYIDGVEVGRTMNDTIGSFETSPAFIGKEMKDELNWRFFNGAIDDLRIYDNALSAEEVAALVPEPTTIALLGIGGLGLLRRRRC
jgi:hypothetical protein